MMDLALEIGLPLGGLRRSLSQRELMEWSRYSEQRGGLPMRRIEILLARIALAFDVGFMGKKNARLRDYLTTEYERAEEVAVDAEHAFGGSGNVVKGNPKAPTLPFQPGGRGHG